LFFRGVFLEPGDHWVEFHFQPRSFLLGGFVSIVTLSGIAIWFAFVALKKRSS
jgi:hypothetical protein